MNCASQGVFHLKSNIFTIVYSCLKVSIPWTLESVFCEYMDNIFLLVSHSHSLLLTLGSQQTRCLGSTEILISIHFMSPYPMTVVCSSLSLQTMRLDLKAWRQVIFGPNGSSVGQDKATGLVSSSLYKKKS